ncbi:MAG: hypothetical protein WA777_01395, partial [Rhodanobacter sp.]
VRNQADCKPDDAVAVDGRAGRSTWIDHFEPKLVAECFATGLWRFNRLILMPIEKGAAKALQRSLQPRCLQLLRTYGGCSIWRCSARSR